MKAITKYVRISPKKLTVIAGLISGKPVNEALDLLEVVPKKGAKILYKTLYAAVSNAETNDKQDRDTLIVSRVVVTKGPGLKRGVPVSRGRYHRIVKRSSNIIIELTTKK